MKLSATCTSSSILSLAKPSALSKDEGICKGELDATIDWRDIKATEQQKDYCKAFITRTQMDCENHDTRGKYSFTMCQVACKSKYNSYSNT